MKKFRLSFVGDIFPGNLIYNVGFGVASNFLKHNGCKWDSQLKDILTNSDIVFGNLESPLVFDEKYSHHNSFAGHLNFANFLKRNEVKIVSIANNHILEHGIDGFKDTCRILKNNKIKYIGLDKGKYSNIKILERNNIKVGFCAFNAIDDIDNPEMYAELNEDILFSTIDKLNKINLDYRIVSLHWGDEYIHYPSESQIDLAHKIIDSNIDIIVGHHPHVVQPIENYRNGLIFYSLGNFLFDMIWSNKVRFGIVANIEFKKFNYNYRVKPIRLSNNYGPILYPKYYKKLNKILKNHTKHLNKRNYINYIFIKRLSKIKERILMKKYLFTNWSKISRKSKIKFINRIKGHILG